MFDREQAILEWRMQMSKAGLRNREVLDELESHLRDEVEYRIRSGLEVQHAFEAAVHNIGQAHELKSEFRKVRNPMINHNRVYTIALAAFGLCNVIIIVFQLVLARAVGGNLNEPMGRYPAWSIPWLFALICVYTGLIVWTLFARRYRPELGRRLSRILNWALLPALPAGTVIGIYGLLATDRKEKQYV